MLQGGALSAAVFWGIGSGFQQVRGPAGSGVGGSGFSSGQMTAKIAAHGAAGGTLSVLQGGKFGHGFVSAGITEAVSPAIAGAGGSGPKGLATRAVLSAAVGGTVSKITGGKFANGAATGAFQSLFSAAASGGSSSQSALSPDDYTDAELQAYVNGSPQVTFDWPSLPQGLVDFSAGMGDTASFGLSKYIRDVWGIDGGVSEFSDLYQTGQIAGIPASAGTVFAGGVVLNMGIRATGGAATLYHFTSATGAAGIAADGMIVESAGIIGRGVYATSLPYGWAAFGARSTQVMIPISTSGMRVGAGLWPGTFRILGSVPGP